MQIWRSVFLFLVVGIYGGFVDLTLFHNHTCTDSHLFWQASVAAGNHSRGLCTDLLVNDTRISVRAECSETSGTIVYLSKDWNCTELNPILVHNDSICADVSDLHLPFTTFAASSDCSSTVGTLNLASRASVCDSSLVNQQIQSLPIDSALCMTPPYRVQTDLTCHIVDTPTSHDQCCGRYEGSGSENAGEPCVYGIAPENGHEFCYTAEDVAAFDLNTGVQECGGVYQATYSSYEATCCSQGGLLFSFYNTSTCAGTTVQYYLPSPGCYPDLFSFSTSLLFPRKDLTDLDWTCPSTTPCRLAEAIMLPVGCDNGTVTCRPTVAPNTFLPSQFPSAGPSFAPSANNGTADSSDETLHPAHVWVIIVTLLLLLCCCYCCGASMGEVSKRTYAPNVNEYAIVNDYAIPSRKYFVMSSGSHSINSRGLHPSINHAFQSMDREDLGFSKEDLGFDKKSYGLMLLTIFAMAMEFGILLPTCWSYVQELGENESFLGITLAAYSAGRATFFPVFGYWCDRRPMIEALTFGFVIGIVGNMMYGLAGWAEKSWYLVLGRYLAGAGSAVITGSTIYIQRTTSEFERLKFVNILSLMFLLGGVIGPACNAILVNIDEEVWIFHFTVETCAGYIMALLNVMLLFFGWCVFVEPPNRKDFMAKDTTFWQRAYYRLIERGGWQNYMMQFYIGISIAGLETALPTIGQEHLGWGVENNSASFAFLGVVIIVGAVFLHILNKRGMSPRNILLVGLISNAVPWVLAVCTFSEKAYTSATLLLFIFLFFSTIVLVMNSSRGLFTMIISNDEYKGAFLASAAMMVSFGRIVGCVVSGVTLDHDLDFVMWWLYFAMFLCSNVCLALAWKKLEFSP